MAAVQHNIDIIFGGNTSALGSAIGTVNEQLNGLESGLGVITAPLANFAETLLELEAAALATGTALAGLAVAEAGNWQDAMGNLGTLFNATSEDVTGLSDDLLAFAKTSTSSFEDIQQAAFIAISTGTDAEDVTKTLTTAQQLASVGNSDLATATGALTRTMNAYGLSAESAGEVSDALFLAAQQGDTDFTKLGSSIGKVAATAAASGVKIDELLSGVVGLTIAGVSTDESMTKLKSLFLELASPSDELKKALGGLSLETDGLQAIMQQLKAVTGGNTTALDELFSSSEALSAATILANDSAGKFGGTLDLMAKKAGLVAKNYEDMVGSFGDTNALVANNLKAALIEAGTPLLDSYAGIGEGIIKIFDAVGTSFKQGNLKQVTDYLAEFGDKVAKYLIGIGDALPGALDKLEFGGLIDSFEDLGAELADVLNGIFGKDLDLTKPEDLAEALQLGVNLLEQLQRAVTGIIDNFKPVFDIIGQAAQKTGEADTEFTGLVGTLSGAALALEKFGVVGGTTVVAINALGADATKVFETVYNGVEIFTNGVHSAFLVLEGAVAGVLEAYYSLADALTIGKAGEKYRLEAEKWSAIGDKIESDIAKNGEDIKASWDSITSAFSSDKAAENQTEFKQTVEENNTAISKSSGNLKEDILANNEAIADSVGSAGDVFKFSGTQVGEYKAKIDELTKAGVAFEQSADSTGYTIKVLGENTSAANEGLSNTATATAEASKALETTTDKTLELTEAQKLTIQQTADLRTKLLEFATDERLKAIEVGGQVKIADIEAEAERIKAAYETVGQTVDATSGSASEMFDSLTGAIAGGNLSTWDKWDLQDQVDRQMDFQEAALEEQTRLNDAQIANLEAKTRALESGGGDIVVKADNLEPELKALLNSLINNIRVEAMKEGLGILT